MVLQFLLKRGNDLSVRLPVLLTFYSHLLVCCLQTSYPKIMLPHMQSLILNALDKESHLLSNPDVQQKLLPELDEMLMGHLQMQQVF